MGKGRGWNASTQYPWLAPLGTLVLAFVFCSIVVYYFSSLSNLVSDSTQPQSTEAQQQQQCQLAVDTNPYTDPSTNTSTTIIMLTHNYNTTTICPLLHQLCCITTAQVCDLNHNHDHDDTHLCKWQQHSLPRGMTVTTLMPTYGHCCHETSMRMMSTTHQGTQQQ